MNQEKKPLVIVASLGLDDERATECWTITNGGLAAGLPSSPATFVQHFR